MNTNRNPSTPFLMLLLFTSWLVPGCAKMKSDALAKDSCPAILHRLQAAKEMWAIEHKKSDMDIPNDTDLFGSSGYMAVKPVCPLGGTYTLGAVKEYPRCSIPGHAY
jgi:hypothetical protein